MSNQTWKVSNAVGVETARAMDEVLALLDAAVPRKFVAMFGSRSSASALLTEMLGNKQALRTPAHRRVMAVLIDATRLPTHIEAWQHMIFTVLEKIGESPAASKSVIQSLREELNELIARERRNDASAALASAAFAHHFRSAFPGLVSSSVAATNSILVVGIARLDQCDGLWALDLLEGSRYFLNAPDCATIIAADEQPLRSSLHAVSADAEKLMATWPTDHVQIPETGPARVVTSQPAAAVQTGKGKSADKRSALGLLPAESARVLKEALGPDQRAIDLACETWQKAIAALDKRNEDGYTTRVSGAHVAKLVALKQLSPALFDAARFDAPLLGRLERAARSGSADMNEPSQRTMALNPQLTALFKSAPNFIGIEPRDTATALRFVFGGEAEPIRVPEAVRLADATTSPAQPNAARARAQRASAGSSLSPVVWLLGTGFGIAGLDRAAKWLANAQPTLPNLTTNSMINSALTLGMEMIGIALAVLILVFWGAARKSRMYHAAFGAIIAGLASNLYDHVTTGGMINHLALLGMSVNIAHVGMLAGAVLLAIAMLRNR
jgi:hypothetical protein